MPTRQHIIQHHISQGDYFKVLGLTFKNILQSTAQARQNKKILENLSQDMHFLQDNYRLVKK